jgi:chemotaxis protein MotB
MCNTCCSDEFKKCCRNSDPDIEINVEKELFLYQSLINYYSKAEVMKLLTKGVLAKVAKVVNDKPDFECMVEGHTDNVPYIGTGILLDNWDFASIIVY